MDDDNSYMGAVTLREALTMSRNIVAVKIAERVGLDKVIDYAHRMGVTAPLEANLSLALGSSGVSVLDQATGFGTIANQGLHIDPTPFRTIKDSLGNVVLDNRVPQETDVVSAGTAYIVTSMLQDVIARGTGYPNAVIGRPAAGKTGTTSSFRDAWFVGFTPDLVAAVWLGNDDYTPMNESYGGNIPARIWARFMKAALAGTPPHEFSFPLDEVEKVAGMRARQRILSQRNRIAVRLRLDGPVRFPGSHRRYRRRGAAERAARRRNASRRTPDAAAHTESVAVALADRFGIASAAALKIYTVGEFSARMHGVFDRVRVFDSIAVSGEVSEWSERNNAVYFTLKDSRAILQCVAYSSRAQKFPNIGPGSAIVAQGRVRVAEWRSRYELLVESVRLTGIGELFQQYEELKERFRRLGYFDREHKLPIPAFPRVVGLVSAQGKGAEDFLTTLQERAPQVRIEFIQTRVQGLGADVEIAEALDRAARVRPDVIVLARGGGSYEDLFPFNCEPVVRAVWRCTTPIITAIGHTADHHLADEVADYVCETPSNAAQFIASLWQRGGERLARLTLKLDREIGSVAGSAGGRSDKLDDALSSAGQRMLLERRQSPRSFTADARLTESGVATGAAWRTPDAAADHIDGLARACAGALAWRGRHPQRTSRRNGQPNARTSRQPSHARAEQARLVGSAQTARARIRHRFVEGARTARRPRGRARG